MEKDKHDLCKFCHTLRSMHQEAQLAHLWGLLEECLPVVFWVSKSHYGTAYRDREKAINLLAKLKEKP